MLGAEPWSDNLALPIAPILLLVQFGALFLWRWWLRWTISGACFAAITAMLGYVASLPVGPDEGVNIGAGLLALWWLCSLVLLLCLAARDLIVIAARIVRWRFANRDVTPS
jgi:hypothetical protein